MIPGNEALLNILRYVAEYNASDILPHHRCHAIPEGARVNRPLGRRN